MEQPENAASDHGKFTGLEILIIALIVEKIVQHVAVTLAFAFNWNDIDATVAVNPDVLMVLGVIVAVLFGLSLWGMWTRRPWAVSLAAGLALFDMVGEFVAQGRLAIDLNVSFLVAAVLLILALVDRRRVRQNTTSVSV